ncbi:unnamed protein product [Adineta steineri]|uniref:SAM domain-containing protein n=1 Tax=Adineta steineri TaxID=433720 RepID=A0A818WN67_9BILA|nr:unnamed protein product [Adineta steineri]CAF0998023.1 unnamed protein product [Adineta steineri]CAF1062439.1 unnamed protein product [Adineta steineri]CAF1215438.1 unnamed protein product [Adineta steineri]CAF3727401.1 unnamed protein product [Adineta steineri]
MSTKSFISQWNIDAVIAWLHESNLGAYEKVFRDNEIDGSILLKLSESMVARLFPTIKLEVQFLDLLQTIKQRHTIELNSKKTLPSSSTLLNGRAATTQQIAAAHVIASSSFDHGNSHSSNSNSPTATNGHHHPSKVTYSERSIIPKTALPLKTLKREPKNFPYQLTNAQANGNSNMDGNENDTKHTFPHVYKLPQFTETLRLALASQDASAFKLRTYYRNLLISSIYDDLTRSYNLWYPNARQYKTVASALVKSYPFLETSTEGGEGAWIDGIKGKFKRGRRTITSYVDAAQSMNAENGYDRMSGDEELGEEKLAQTSGGQKRSRHEFEVDSDDGQYESGEMPINGNGKDTDQTSENNDDIDEDELNRLRTCITAMQETLATTDDPDISLISDYFKETFEIRRTFVKTHNTNEILTEYPALQLHSCLLADFHMQTNIPIQTVLIHKLRSISKPILRLAKETGCAPEILHSYHTILSQRPQLEQIVADTFAILIVASYFGEYQFLLISSDKDSQSPWPIIRGDHPARAFFDGKSSSLSYNIELDYVQLFHRPLNDFLTAICTLFATYTVFEITYGKLEMTLSFIDCLLRDNAHSSTRSPQVHELINELISMK